MATGVKKGNQVKYKVANWFKERGFEVDYLEFYGRTRTGFMLKVDKLGSDGYASNETEFILWNSIADKSNRSRDAKKMLEHRVPNWIKRYIVTWETGQKEPIFYNVDTKLNELLVYPKIGEILMKGVKNG